MVTESEGKLSVHIAKWTSKKSAYRDAVLYQHMERLLGRPCPARPKTVSRLGNNCSMDYTIILVLEYKNLLVLIPILVQYVLGCGVGGGGATPWAKTVIEDSGLYQPKQGCASSSLGRCLTTARAKERSVLHREIPKPLPIQSASTLHASHQKNVQVMCWLLLLTTL